jgi:hypothetical protein
MFKSLLIRCLNGALFGAFCFGFCDLGGLLPSLSWCVLIGGMSTGEGIRGRETGEGERLNGIG